MSAQEECCWPDLPERFDMALREAVSFILGRFNVAGIVAAGSIIRGTPDPTSDLDIYVVNREPTRQRLQKFFRGVPAEIFVNPVSTIRCYFAKDHADGRPITAHMLATGFVVLSRDQVVDQLRTEAADWLARPSHPSPSRLVIDRYMAAAKYEDALDTVSRDLAVALLMLNQAVIAMLHFWFRSNGLFIPRTKEILFKLVSLDKQLGVDAKRFFTVPHEERWPLAERIADRTIGVHGFFEWESEPEVMGK